MWYLILSSAFIALAAGMIYLTFAVGRFGFIRRLAKEKKGAAFLISLGVNAAGFGLAVLVTSLINALVIYLHVILFFLIFGLIIRIAEKASGRKSKYNLQGILAVVCAVVYFAVGWFQCVNVRQTGYDLATGKDLGELRIALIADSHIGTTFDGEGFAAHIKGIEAQEPDILLIAGDFVDDWSNREDMLTACRALGQADIKYGVWMVFGNHDHGFFSDRDFTADELRQALGSYGVHLLEDECELVDGRFYVAGRRDKSSGRRMTTDELLKDADRDKYIILLDHQPSDYEGEAGRADLVLSGHTHGGQMIPILFVGELFGIVDNNYGYENRNGTDFIVTSGISDWELLFKTGTSSEYVIINVG